MVYVFRADSPGDPNGAGMATRLTFVGPFADAAEAKDFFRTTGHGHLFADMENPNNPHDDPRWWVMDRVELSFSPTGSAGDLYVADIMSDDRRRRVGVVLRGPFADAAAILACEGAYADEWTSCRLEEPATVRFVAPEGWAP